mgnify:CR=1 FL=1
MGIKNLLKLINMYPDLIEEKEIEDFKNKKIAIDISILLYQFVISVRNTGSDLTNKKGELTSHILGLFNKTIRLLENNIIPVFVFDGKPPDLKKKVLDVRRSIRKKAEEKMAMAVTEEEKIGVEICTSLLNIILAIPVPKIANNTIYNNEVCTVLELITL